MKTITYFEDLTQHEGHEMQRQPEWYKAWKPDNKCPICGAKVEHEEKTKQAEDDMKPFVRVKSDTDKAIS